MIDDIKKTLCTTADALQAMDGVADEEALVLDPAA